jgi:DNA-binding MarR family transcriptional regulator
MPTSESVEEYLEALWISEERGEKLAHLTWVADHLGIAAPSALEMLKKLEKEGYVIYRARQGIELTEKGRKIAKRIIRAHRLTEAAWNTTWMKNSWMPYAHNLTIQENALMDTLSQKANVAHKPSRNG